MSLLPGGQNPITLEYQIYPPTIDTLVTGMGAIGSRGPGVCQIKHFRLGCKVMNIKREGLKMFLAQDPSISKFLEVKLKSSRHLKTENI